VDSSRWFALLIAVLALGVFLRLPVLITLDLMLILLLGVASWWQKHALDGVTYRRKPFYRRAFPGERVPIRLEVENRKWLPLSWLRIQDPWPKAIAPEETGAMALSHLPEQGILTNVFGLRWFETARRQYTLLFSKRGVYSLGPARLESGDLFGVFDQSQEQGPVEHLTVFPTLVPFSDLRLSAEDPFGDRRSRRRLYEDLNQPIGVRDYLPEDSFRRVHWGATAHTGQLQVKVFQPASANVMVICLNVSTFARHWEGTNPELLEHLIQVAATLANQGIQSGYRVGLVSNGCLSNADQPFRIPPGRSPKQLATLLEALAGVTPVTTALFERFLIKEIPRVPYGATLVILTGVNSPELAEALVKLRHHGRYISLISFAEQPPQTVEGIKIVHLPFAGTTQERENSDGYNGHFQVNSFEITAG
jgi:uncharacterized protein (DUF58 family)